MGTSHFAGHAADYACFRPDYPPELFAWLAAQCSEHECALDVGTGSGQAAVALAGHFRQVVATDVAAEQIAHARPHPGVAYRVAPAQASGLAAASVDLVTVAQALHWFDFAPFYAEARRVLKPGGLLAAWTYTLVQEASETGNVAGGFNALLGDFHDRILGRWWPPQRAWVMCGYRGLPFPCAVLPAPSFSIRREWTRADLLAYLRTWSATQRCIKESGVDPTAELDARLAAAWPDHQTRPLLWPIALLAGRP